MKLTHPLLFKAGGLLFTPLLQAWIATLDCKFWFPKPGLDPAYPNTGQRLYLFWHEYIFYPLAVRGHCRLTMLLSRHQDAQIVGELAARLGFDCVRGSTNRGGAKAIRELKEASKSRNLTIAADGPRGPRREMGLGPIYIASRLRLPIVLFGFGYGNEWRVNSWDRFAVPCPGTRARGIASDEIIVPADADRKTLEEYRVLCVEQLNRTTQAAEEWARNDRPLLREIPVLPGPKSSLFHGYTTLYR